MIKSHHLAVNLCGLICSEIGRLGLDRSAILAGALNLQLIGVKRRQPLSRPVQSAAPSGEVFHPSVLVAMRSSTREAIGFVRDRNVAGFGQEPFARRVEHLDPLLASVLPLAFVGS